MPNSFRMASSNEKCPYHLFTREKQHLHVEGIKPRQGSTSSRRCIHYSMVSRALKPSCEISIRLAIVSYVRNGSILIPIEIQICPGRKKEKLNNYSIIFFSEQKRPNGFLHFRRGTLKISPAFVFNRRFSRSPKVDLLLLVQLDRKFLRSQTIPSSVNGPLKKIL